MMKHIAVRLPFSAFTASDSTEKISRFKKYIIVTAFLILILLILPVNIYAIDYDDTGSEYTVGFLGQFLLGYAYNNDMYNFIEESYLNYTDANGTSNVDRNSMTNMTIGFHLEGRYYLSKLALGAGFGYNYAAGSVEDTGLIIPRDVASAKLYVTHYTLTCYYNFRIGENSAFLIGLGAGYYRAKLEIMMRDFFLIFFSSYHERNTYRDYTFGAHAKIEYGYLFFGHVLLHAGIQARYASFNDLKDSENNRFMLNGTAQKAGLTGFVIYLGAGIML